MSRVLGLLAALAMPVAAQDGAWRIPERGAAVWTRGGPAPIVRPPEIDRGRGLRRPIRVAREGGHAWRWRELPSKAAPDGFERADYDDSAWSGGLSPFGNGEHATRWTRRVLDARTTFDTGRRRPRAGLLVLQHDDALELWLNGVSIYANGRHGHHHRALDDAALAALVTGVNVLAARCENTGGAAVLDVGLVLSDRPLSDPARTAEVLLEPLRAADRVRNELFVDWRSPPILCAGQLDAERERIALPPIELRDVAPYLALDLDRAAVARTWSAMLPRTWKLGDVQLKVRTDAIDAHGRQRLSAAVDSRPIDPAGDPNRAFDAQVAPYHAYDVSGRLEIERELDLAAGFVRGFHARLDASIVARGGPADPLELVLEERWSDCELRANRDARFQADVHAAIARGVAKLRREIGSLGVGHLRNEPSGDRSYNSGRLALALLAMVHGGAPRDDEIVARGFAELAERRIIDTYSLANAIMAVEAKYAPLGEHEDLRAGNITAPRPRQPEPDDLARIRGWTEQLLTNIDSRVDRGYLVRFNYVPGARYDHSVNQYGLLGLYSAHLCGVAIPATVWEGAANHLVDDQDRAGKTVRLELVSHRQFADASAGRTTTVSPRPARVAGWGYYGPRSNGVPEPIYGSMTCAGITGLTVCEAGMRDADQRRSELFARADAAIRNGFAWLAENFTVHWHPGRMSHRYSHFYYYLYGLERACELSGIALIQGRDWYYEGALALLDQQQADGGWPPEARAEEVLERTAMAVLFLKKATAPVYTQGDR